MKDISVIRNDGVSGKVVGEEEQGYWIIEFNDGSSMVVSPDILVQQDDGTYYLSIDTNIGRLKETLEEGTVIPVIAEELLVETQRVAREVVRVNKRVETREEVINTTLSQERVKVERVPINKLVEDDQVPKIRKENGILIIPVIEEVLVVEKRLLVREEVRVTRLRTQENIPKTILLRREVVDIERSEPDGTEIL